MLTLVSDPPSTLIRRRIVAILDADVVAYSRLVLENEERTLLSLLKARDIFQAHITARGGRIFNTAGDAILAEFGSAVEALRAAVEIQEQLKPPSSGSRPTHLLQFRIGLTVGEVVENDSDLLGDAVNMASRIEGVAEPGGICLSSVFRDNVAGKLHLPLRDLGERTLKNIPRPVRVFAVGEAAASKALITRTSIPVRTALLGLLAFMPGASTSNIVPLPPSEALGPPAPSVSAPLPVSISSPKVVQAAEPRALPLKPAQTDSRATAAISAPSSEGSLARPITAERLLSMAGRAFKAEEVPFICEDCRRKIALFFGTDRPHSALAISKFGAAGYIAAQPTAEDAQKQALEFCTQRGGQDCMVFALDGRVVWDHAFPPLPPKPWPTQGREVPRSELDEAAAGWPVKDYSSRPSPKALAVGPRGAWAIITNAAGTAEAVRRALESCGYMASEPCRIVAVDNSIVAPARVGDVSSVSRSQ